MYKMALSDLIKEVIIELLSRKKITTTDIEHITRKVKSETKLATSDGTYELKAFHLLVDLCTYGTLCEIAEVNLDLYRDDIKKYNVGDVIFDQKEDLYAAFDISLDNVLHTGLLTKFVKIDTQTFNDLRKLSKYFPNRI